MRESERTMNGDSYFVEGLKRWTRSALAILALVAAIWMPMYTAMNHDSAQARASVVNEDGKSETLSIMDEVRDFLDALERAQAAHNQAAAMTSDMKSVIDEIEASENLAADSTHESIEQARLGNSSKSMSLIAPSEANLSNAIEDDETPLSANSLDAPKSRSLISPKAL